MYGGAKNYSPPGTGQNNQMSNYNATLPSTFNVPEAKLTSTGQQVFARYDTNNSGKVPLYMLARMLEEFAYMNNTRPPVPADMEHYMQVFDMDGDDQLALWEWMRGLKSLAGYQAPPRPIAQNTYCDSSPNNNRPIIIRERSDDDYWGSGLGLGAAGLGGLGLGLALGSGPRFYRPYSSWGWGLGYPMMGMGWGHGCHHHHGLFW